MTATIDTHWTTRAACRSHDPELWFSTVKADRDRARAICAGCPVRKLCEDASGGEQFGTWGGQDRDTGRKGAAPVDVKCPICGDGVSARGLRLHARLAHDATLTRCAFGHDLTGPDATKSNGECRECARRNNREWSRRKRTA